jgi:predicted transposase YdaD
VKDKKPPNPHDVFAKETAQKMLEEGLDVSLIARVTGLSEEVVRALQGKR